jgi:hypothetical protein
MDNVYAEVKEKKERRKKYFLLFWLLVGVYLVLLVAGLFLFRSPFFHFQKFEVVGNERVSTEDVVGLLQARALQGAWRPLKALLGLHSMLIWPDMLSESDLAFLPSVKSVILEKNYADRTITVIVKERQPYGIWCTDEDAGGPVRCMWFDTEGVLFERAIAAQGGIIMTVHDHSQKSLPLRGNILPEALTPNIFSIFKVLAASDIDRNEIVLDDLALEEVKVTTHNGPELYFSLRFSAENDLAAIQDLMAKPGFGKLQYLDFRAENRVYYK